VAIGSIRRELQVVILALAWAAGVLFIITREEREQYVDLTDYDTDALSQLATLDLLNGRILS